jgi:hypothetical protein
MTIKPEGSAQEPQCTCDKERDMHGDLYEPCAFCQANYVPATPTPSQPAAREKNWLVEAVENCPDPVLKQNCKQLLGNDYTNAAVQFIVDAQTAAKDAEIARLTAFVSGDGEPDVMAAMWMADRAALPNGDTRDRFIEEARRLFRLNRTAQSDREAAERERDSLRETLNMILMLADTNDSVKHLARSALKAGKDGQK